MNSHCYFIATSWNAAAIPQHFIALARELARAGHRVLILVDGRKREIEDHRANPAVYAWPSRRPTGLRDALFLRRLIRKYRPDCLVSNFGADNVMMLVGWLLGVPCRVNWYHTLSSQIDRDRDGSRRKIKFLMWRKRLVYKAATHIVANSKAARHDVQSVFYVPGRKCQAFHYSLGDPLIRPVMSQESNGVNRLVCAGRLYPTKGQDVLVRAMALLKQALPDVLVEFLGDGPFKESCLELARRLGVEDVCVFAGSMPHDEVLTRMASAVSTVVPSRSEAFGIVNIESLAVGTPVVASDVGGIAGIIRDGVDGFLVPPDDPAALAEKLKLLLSNPDLAETMSRNARQRFLAQFERGKIVSGQARWLENIVASNPRKSTPNR